jgi:restriction endonuclease S subunit
LVFACYYKISVKGTGFNPAIRRTVIGTTIPHLREERLKQIAIPIIDKDIIHSISGKVRQAFELKAKRKKMICDVLFIKYEFRTKTN